MDPPMDVWEPQVEIHVGERAGGCVVWRSRPGKASGRVNGLS